jgi:hypothetical protein
MTVFTPYQPTHLCDRGHLPREQKAVQAVEAENNKLRRQVAKEMERSKTFQSRTQDLLMAKEQLMQQLVELKGVLSHREETERSQGLPEKYRSLKAAHAQMEMELKEQQRLVSSMLNPTMNKEAELRAETRRMSRELEGWKLRAGKLTEQVASATRLSQSLEASGASPAKGGEGEWRGRLERLEQENQRLRVQVEQGEARHAEGLEDLNHNYREAVRLNVKYEEAIHELGSRAHLDVTRILQGP